MVKYTYLAILIAAASTACGDANKHSEVEDKTDTITKQSGLPLDNIHRSRPQDMNKENDKSKEQGIPLDNLDRDKPSD
ncbi:MULTISPECIES: hypothetical protein [unclassified Sphingobacterium]|uniref:hypothetical protein n=1 Tax=unclassified Sphingobacterium TaxID=2609468 RepID=UPI0025CEAEA0|nr:MULTISPECIES: hypothetical protein [unclassified Sphingobacterium]